MVGKVSPWGCEGRELLLLSKASGFGPCLFVVAALSIVRIGTVLNLVLYACAGNAALSLGGLPGLVRVRGEGEGIHPFLSQGWIFQQRCQHGLGMIWGSRLASMGKGLLFAQLHIFIHNVPIVLNILHISL